jgi:hypothetical protein
VLTRATLVVTLVALATSVGWWAQSRSTPRVAAPSTSEGAPGLVPASSAGAAPELRPVAEKASDLRARVAESRQLSDHERARIISILDEEQQARERLLDRVRDAELPRARASEAATLARNAAHAKIKALLGDARWQQFITSAADSDSRH